MSSESSRRQQEQDAFNELQSYAKFQDKLSSRVIEEISGDDRRSSYPESIFSVNGARRSELRSSTGTFGSQSGNQLPYPIFIPQNATEYGRLCWARAFSPSLLSCGIEQQNFLRFLDSFNKSLEVGADLKSWLKH